MKWVVKEWDEVQGLDVTFYIKDTENNEMIFIKSNKVSDFIKLADTLNKVSPWEDIAGVDALKSFDALADELSKKSKVKVKNK